MNAFMQTNIYIYIYIYIYMCVCVCVCVCVLVERSVSHKGRSRFTRDCISTRFLSVILSARRQISGLRMYQKGRPSENILLLSSSLCGSDRCSARINKNRNVGSNLRLEHSICEPMKTVPCTELYTIIL
jgi:hypothetical protein